MLSQRISYINTPEDWTTIKGKYSLIAFVHSLTSFRRNFTQFYSTKTERDKKLLREYETQMDYRKHLQAFIDRWRYNANRGANMPFVVDDKYL